MIKILHIVDSAGFYGAEIVILNLMESQIKSGLKPLLLSLGNFGVKEKEIEKEARMRNLPYSVLRFRDGLNFIGSRKIIKFANELNIDVIHSHGYKANILLGLMPKYLRKIPIIATLHGWTGIKLMSKMYFYHWLDSLVLKKLDRVVVVSSSQCSKPFLKVFGIQTVIINNGIPQLVFNKSFEGGKWIRVINIGSNTFKILVIGRLSKLKGLDVLVKSFTSLLKEKTDLDLGIIGEGSEEKYLKKLVYLNGVSEKVHFLGYYDHAYKLIPFFDVFVISSYTEGLPITLLEAMQAGTPIVATAVGEIPRVLKNGELGQLVPPGDVEALSHSILRVFQNPAKYKKMASEAKKHVLQEYSLEKMAQKYTEVYQEVISLTGKKTA